MINILIGAQWGDEGKGKIIDLLTQKHDVIVRFQGGANAGHTVRFGSKEYVLHLIPSGILHSKKVCVIGNGVVVDPRALFQEIELLERDGIEIEGRLFISEQAHLIMPYHQLIDKLREEAKRGKIGTTKRGIGPCYADKTARLGIRMIDLIDRTVFRERLQMGLEEKNKMLRRIYNHSGLSFQKLYNEYLAYGKRLKPYLTDTTVMLNDAIRKKKRILFEGAQGTLLDVDHGTYPYVTSSNATVGGAMTGAGIPPHRVNQVIGVVKAYTTRVGEGPFPTEFPPELTEVVRTRGEEYGATTGRPRRCGWFDAVIGRHSVMVNGLDRIAVTKLDVLDRLKTIKICFAYRHGGKRYTHFPASLKVLEECTPLYEEHRGWREDTRQVRNYNKLPVRARRYLKRMSELLQTPVSIVSVGSLRSQTIFL